jgi:triosephosphate isomerase
MHKTLSQTREYMTELASARLPDTVQVFVLPAHTSLSTARECLGQHSRVLLGAQNAHWATTGGWTGEISMEMARDAGASIVQVGHSERRQHFGERDENVAAKVRAAVEHELTPLVCVGEPRTVFDAGEAVPFVLGQLERALEGLDQLQVARILVAYEPVWSIGENGVAAHPADVAGVVDALRAGLDERSGGEGCRALLYGGSVDGQNALAFLEEAGIDGLFAGRFAWSVDGLLGLVELAASAAASS